jgi:hypothetical protein
MPSLFAPLPDLRPRLLRAPLLSALLLVAACDGETDPDPEAGILFDADMVEPDAGPQFPDGAVLCFSDAECDDGIDCTEDVCGSRGFCIANPRPEMCQDGEFCNGDEICDVDIGCAPGNRRTCDDADFCTVDRCDEANDQCVYLPQDRDGDGDPDFVCDNGGDCDDLDRDRASTFTEICDDFIDNDCDGLADDVDPEGCGAPPHDLCEDALDVTEGGFFPLNLAGSNPDHPSSCVPQNAMGNPVFPDLAATFTLEEARQVEVTVAGEAGAQAFAVLYEGECLEETEIVCRSGFPANFTRRNLEAGTYFILISATRRGPVDLTVTYSDPIEPPPNGTCEGALDVSAGGLFSGDFTEVTDDYTLGCNTGEADLVYAFTTTEAQDVVIDASSVRTTDIVGWEVRAVCDDADSALRCSNRQGSGRIYSLPAGTYSLIIENPTGSEAGFNLNVAFEAPTVAPPGESCDEAPIVLTPNAAMPFAGDYDGYQDVEPALFCGARQRDVVHEFTIAESSDVTVTLDQEENGSFSLRTDCSDEDTELLCPRGTSMRGRFPFLEAGRYFVVAQSTGTGPEPYTLAVDAAPRAEGPIAVTGNDTCATAQELPLTGGLFSGTTVGATNNLQARCGFNANGRDVAYTFTLTEERRLVAETIAATPNLDMVLALHRNICIARGELVCSDMAPSSGTEALIDEVLAAGTYFLIVDTAFPFQQGEYFLDVRFEDPPP